MSIAGKLTKLAQAVQQLENAPPSPNRAAWRVLIQAKLLADSGYAPPQRRVQALKLAVAEWEKVCTVQEHQLVQELLPHEQ